MCLGAVLFVSDAARSVLKWALAAPVVILALFMTTLAAVFDDGEQIYIKRWWATPRRVPKKDAVGNEASLLEDIGRLHLRWFVFPWGQIYFVRAWPITSKEKEIARPWSRKEK
jgi:hypothetical protein